MTRFQLIVESESNLPAAHLGAVVGQMAATLPGRFEMELTIDGVLAIHRGVPEEDDE